ncbi:MAG TPA: fibronectin type III domain-containing protein [Polyangiaceae bacterium]|nr:fibronectin type III domain-containing protein [Polyangiaceae bacterium]
MPETAPSAVSAAAGASVGTVVTVTWTTNTPAVGYVSYGTTSKLEQYVPFEATPATAHARTLLGLTPDTTYYYRVITWDAANATAGASDTLSFHTAPLPAGSPKLTAQSFPVMDNGALETPMASMVLVPFVGTKTTVGIVDPTGALVWYHAEDRADRRVTRARLSSDGKTVFYSAVASGAAAADSEIVRAPIDGSATSSIKVANLGPDFTVDATGVLGALVPDVRMVNGANVTGDKLVEIAADGTQKQVWSAFDCFDPATSPGDGSDGVWSGASALQVDSGHNAYFVALKNLSSIAKIDRMTGKCTWIVGSDPKATLHFAAGSSPFARPGSFYAEDTKLVVFDAAGDAAGARAITYTLDPTALTATQTQAYPTPPSVKVPTQGESSLITGNDVLVNFGGAAKLELADPRGQLKWTLHVDSGESLGYQTPFRNFYAPTIEGNH